MASWCGHLCKIKANKGCVVRKSHEMDSEVVGELEFGVNVRVWEAGFTVLADGDTKIGRVKITHPFEGWLSGKCIEVLPQGMPGGAAVPRASDFDSAFKMVPMEAPKAADGPPKTYVPASIKVVCLNVFLAARDSFLGRFLSSRWQLPPARVEERAETQVPEDERNGNTRYKAGWAHGQPTVTTDRESRANTEIYQWEAGKDGAAPEMTSRMSFHGFASRALPPGMKMG